MALYSEDFEGGTTDMTVSGSYSGVVSDYPISGAYSGSVGGDAETMTSPTIALAGDAQFHYDLKKDSNRNVAESADSVRVEYYTDTGSWALLQEHFGSEFSSNQVISFTQTIPADGIHSGFQFRFVSSGTSGPYDYWYFDSLSVELLFGISTDPVSALASDSVTFNATPSPNGTNNAWFQWGPAGGGFPNTTSPQSVSDSTPISETVTGLSSRTEYEVRAVIDDGFATTTGETVAFTTHSETPVGLTWTPSVDSHDNERVYRTSTVSPTFPNDYTQIAELGASTGTYDDYQAPEGSSLTYAVVSVSSLIESTETTVSITTPAPSGGTVTESVDATTESSVSLVSVGAVTTTASVDTATASATSTVTPGEASEPTVSVGDVTRGLVAKLALDGDTTDSWGSHDGSAFTGSYESGHMGQAATFTGTEYVDLPSSLETALNGVSEATFAVWVQADASGVDMSIFGDRPDVTGGDVGNGIRFDSSGWAGDGSNVLKVAVATTGGETAGETVSGVQSTDPMHIVWSWSSGTAGKVYINGVEQGWTATPTSLSGTLVVNDMMLGRALKEGDGWWQGWIDEYRAYNVQLTDQEVADLYAYDGTGSSTVTESVDASTVSAASVVSGGLSAVSSAGVGASEPVGVSESLSGTPAAVAGVSSAVPSTVGVTVAAPVTSVNTESVEASVVAAAGVAPVGVPASVGDTSAGVSGASASVVGAPVGAVSSVAASVPVSSSRYLDNVTTDTNTESVSASVEAGTSHASVGTLTAAADVAGGLTPASSALVAPGVTARLDHGASLPLGFSTVVAGVATEPSATYGEAGIVTLSGTIDAGHSATVTFSGSYTNPVVVAGLVTANERSPVAVRARNLTSTSVELFMENPSDGSFSTAEDVSYVVFDEGTHTTTEGATIEAGLVTVPGSAVVTGGGSPPTNVVNTANSFVDPVVLALPVSYNNGEFMTQCVTDISSSSFNLVQEATETGHEVGAVDETFAYVVMEAGSGTIEGVQYEAGYNTGAEIHGWEDAPGTLYTATWGAFAEPPVLVTVRRTRNGADGGWIRPFNAVGTASADLVTDECLVKDGERSHGGSENASWLVVEPGSVFGEPAAVESVVGASVASVSLVSAGAVSGSSASVSAPVSAGVSASLSGSAGAVAAADGRVLPAVSVSDSATLTAIFGVSAPVVAAESAVLPGPATDLEVLAAQTAISASETVESAVFGVSEAVSGPETAFSAVVGGISAFSADSGASAVISAGVVEYSPISAISAVSGPISASSGLISPAEVYVNLFLRAVEGGSKTVVVSSPSKEIGVRAPSRAVRSAVTEKSVVLAAPSRTITLHD